MVELIKNSNTALYAVMGNPIAHSLSPLIHQSFAQQTGISSLSYEKIKIDEALFEDKVRYFFHQGGKGLNVTLPFKERAFAMADIRTPRCQQAGAANTLWMKDHALHADNTDGIGLLRDLHRHIDVSDKNLLVLGAGGAARGVIGALLQAKPASLTLCNRTRTKADKLQHCFPKILICDFEALTQNYEIVINATSASLDEQSSLSLPLSILKNEPFCYDLVYQSNGLTSFVQWARTNGCRASDGLGMLIEQAAEAFFIWHGVMPDTTIVRTPII